MKTLIPSPLPFLTQLPDPRNPNRIKHSLDTFWKVTLTALSTGCRNILEISEWIHNNQQCLLVDLNIRTKQNQATLPSQASLYRFLWMVEQQLEQFEQLLLKWLKFVLNKLDLNQELIGVNLDGKYLLGTKRSRAGERSFIMLGAFINVLGVMLTQKTVTGTETQTAKSLIPILKTMFNTGSWVVTMDAGVTEQDLAKKVVKAGGHFLMQIKKNQLEAWQMLHWVFHYPIGDTGTTFCDDEQRSGEHWIWHTQTSNALPEELRKSFPNAVLAVQLERTVVRVETGEVRLETCFALTSANETAKDLYGLWRGHWGIENKSHHKRDTVFGEDACRTRLAGRVLAGLRNALLSMFHLENQSVLRCVRRFSSHVGEALEFLGLKS
jgi:DDE_Tnp_1-associated/Transposase DDE domain